MSLTPALRRLTAADLSDLVPGFHDVAKSALLVGAGVYAGFAALHLMLQPPGLRTPLFVTAAATAVLLAAFRIVVQREFLPHSLLRWAMFAVVMCAWFNSSLHLWLSGDPMQTTNLAIVIIGAGIVLIDYAEFAAIVALSLLAVAGEFAFNTGGAIWIHYAIHLIEATVLASATFVWKRMILARSGDLRRQELQARMAAEQILRRAQEADVTLRENEERFRMLFALAPVGIALNRMDDGRFLIGSKALFEMVDYSEAEFANLTYWDITPRDYDAEEAQQLESLRNHGRYGPYEKEYIRKGGARFPCCSPAAV